MLFGPNKISYFNELEINGENVDDDDSEDYTNDEQEPEQEGAEDETQDTGDDLDDFTEDEFEADEDETEDTGDETTDEPEPASDDSEDNTQDEDNLDDFTEDEFEADEDETEDTGDESTTGDSEGEDTESETGEDDITDFTEDEYDSEGGEEDTDETGGDDTEDSEDDNTLAGMEKNLFSDLSPQQMAIKNNELLHNYIELYETINTIFDSINKIPKTIDNTRPLSFIADQLVELKDMVNYTITTTYVTRTYVENMTYYKQALVILEQLNTMLKALVQKPVKS